MQRSRYHQSREESTLGPLMLFLTGASPVTEERRHRGMGKEKSVWTSLTSNACLHLPTLKVKELVRWTITVSPLMGLVFKLHMSMICHISGRLSITDSSFSQGDKNGGKKLQSQMSMEIAR